MFLFIFDLIFCRNLGAKAFEVSADKKYVYLAHDSFKVKLRRGEKLIFPQNKKDQKRKLSLQQFFLGRWRLISALLLLLLPGVMLRVYVNLLFTAADKILGRVY